MITIHDLGRSGVMMQAGHRETTYTFQQFWRAAVKTGRINHNIGPEPPEHLTKPRLPIAGETKADWFRKLLFYCGEFGHWIASQKRRIEYENLLDVIEQEMNPYAATAEDAFAVVYGSTDDMLDDMSMRFRAAWESAGIKRTRTKGAAGDEDDELEDEDDAFSYATYDDMFRGERGVEYDDVAKELSDAYAGWTNDCGCGHACNVRVVPIAWPEIAGVYFVLAGDRVKIGKAKNVLSRLRDLQTSAPYKLELLAVVPGGLAEEAAFHKKFKSARLQGEWFTLSADILEFIAVARSERVET